MLITSGVNQWLDRLAQPEVRLFGRGWRAFQMCGFAGLSLALVLAFALALRLHLSMPVMAGIALIAIFTLFALTILTRLITGEEKLIYFHHQIAVIVATTFFLWLLEEPIISYLDVTILSVGVFLVCGRIGCLMVGCCHGRPHAWGICYRSAHADAGFSRRFLGVRLFPVQALEAVWVLGTVIAGSVIVWRESGPGQAFASYVISYGVGRFFLEMMRGDAARPYLGGFSQAQWLSLLTICSLAGLELVGIIDWRQWHAGAAGFLVLVMIAVSLRRRMGNPIEHQLLLPRHIAEVIDALNGLSAVAAAESAMNESSFAFARVHATQTALGIQLSASLMKHPSGDVCHYAVSSSGRALNARSASRLARLMLHLQPLRGTSEFVEGTDGVYHLLIRPHPWSDPRCSDGGRPAAFAISKSESG